MAHDEPFRIDEEATRALFERVRLARETRSAQAAAREHARLLGAHPIDGRAEFGFWLPVEAERGSQLFLELLHPEAPVHFGTAQEVVFVRRRLPLRREGPWALLAVSGVRAGARDVCGTLYRVLAEAPDGVQRYHGDPLAASLPFGVHGPAEVYDLHRMHQDREDRRYFLHVAIGGEDDEPPRIGPPTHVLQVHVGTATHGGTVADLADLYRALGEKVRREEALTPAERTFLGFDAVQLLPLEPQAENPAAPPRFELGPPADEALVEDGARVTARLRPPDGFGWGYDAPIFGSAAIAPHLLRSGRPDELVDLACALHTFPGKPIGLLLDLLLGHAHEQALSLLPGPFFSGPSRDGHAPAYGDPAVRAILLEARRRKGDYGADGVRIGAAHDVRVWSEAAGGMVHDDAFLRELSDVVQEVADVHYRTCMVFEDGRPWPREDWPTQATYLDVVRDQPQAFQWGPLTFSRNAPTLEGFWASTWWRIEQIAEHGERWITGTANHDTLRRAYHLPSDAPVNGRLGGSLPEVVRRAFAHPAADLLFQGALPGIPMTFVAAAAGAPWAFVRHLDDRRAVQVMAEEAGFFAWRGDPGRYAAEGAFPRCKALGFDEVGPLTRLLLDLREALRDGDDDDPDHLAHLAAERGAWAPFEIDGERLRDLARAVMRDLHEHCVVWRFQDALDEERVAFDTGLRRFRRERPWLRRDLRAGERLERRVRPDGGTLVAALRRSPDASEEVGLLANLEGEAWTITPSDLLGDAEAWEPAVAAPGVDWQGAASPLELRDAQGVLVVRRT